MQERHKRIHIRTGVKVGGRKVAEALDLSIDGMYVFTSHTYIEGVTVNLEFTLYETDYDIRATIKHVEEGVGFGVNFVDMPDEDSKRLLAYVEVHS